MCDRKWRFLPKKRQKNHKNHFRKILLILNIEGSILETVRDCENASTIGLRDSRRSRFSALVGNTLTLTLLASAFDKMFKMYREGCHHWTINGIRPVTALFYDTSQSLWKSQSSTYTHLTQRIHKVTSSIGFQPYLTTLPKLDFFGGKIKDSRFWKSIGQL